MTPALVLVGGVVYILAYALAVILFPSLASSLRPLLRDVFLTVPAMVALGLLAGAAAATRGSERAFWTLLCGAAGCHVARRLLLALHVVWLDRLLGLRLAAHVWYFSYLVLLGVALLARPDRPRAPREVRGAAVEWAMGAVGGYFVLLYLLLLPLDSDSLPAFFIYVVQELAPGVGAGVLALRTEEKRYRQIYGLLALGLLASAAGLMATNWSLMHGQYRAFTLLDIPWALPFIPMAAAATVPRGPSWIPIPWPAAIDRRRARLAMVAVAIPPFVDLAARALVLQPALAEERSEIALGASALLSTLVAVRVWMASREPVADVAAAPRPLTEPSELLHFASGVAHELNNPLMAVAGWAELAARRGGAREPLEALLKATRRAADAVARVSQLARSAETPSSGGLRR